MKKVIVIGSGIAGIATSIRLQAAGYQVSIYEQNRYPGGKLSEIRFHDFRFDAGPSLFTMPHFVEELFTLCDKKVSDYFSYKKKENICNYFFADGKQFISKANQDDFIQNACKVFDVEEQNLKSYLENSKLKYDRTATLFLEKSLHKLKTYFSKDTIHAIASLSSLHLMKSLHQVNSTYFKDKNLIQFFNRFATYNGSNPYQTPGIMSLIPHLEQYYGTYFPKGGMISITSSLVQLAQEIGVQFHYNSTIEKIEISEHHASGVFVNKNFIEADIVVSNMDIVPTYRKLMPTQKAPERILKQERSSSALIFYWGIEKTFPMLDLHNIFFAKDYRAEFEAIFKHDTIADDITVYVNISSKEQEKDAPPNCENWFVLINAPGNKNQDWEHIIERTRANVIAKLSDTLKINLKEYISCESVLDPRTIESKTQSYQGSLYGAASNSQFAAFMRHPNFSQKIKNLFFCGGSIHPGGGIPLCLLSAKITCDLIKTSE